VTLRIKRSGYTNGPIDFTMCIIPNPFSSVSVPTIQFERSGYSIPEPSVKDQIATVTLRVERSGDVSRTASVRCSTQDGSAMGGTDFSPKSQVLVFAEG